MWGNGHNYFVVVFVVVGLLLWCGRFWICCLSLLGGGFVVFVLMVGRVVAGCFGLCGCVASLVVIRVVVYCLLFNCSLCFILAWANVVVVGFLVVVVSAAWVCGCITFV